MRPSVDQLRQVLRYEPETGKLFWLERPVSMFPNAHRAAAWNAHYAGKEALYNRNARGYLKGLIFGKTYATHRVAWALKTGAWPPSGVDIDHINCVKSDNRVANLRLATRAENCRNKGPSAGRAYRGVTKGNAKPLTTWRAQCLGADGALHQIDGLSSPEEAARARDGLALTLHGDFARLNFPMGAI